MAEWLVVTTACRSPVVSEGGGFRHREIGYRIGAPPGPPGAWRRVSADNADLAFRGPGGALLSLASRCRAPLAEPRILARHLRFSLGSHELRRSAPAQVAGLPAFSQELEVASESGPVRVKTVTLVVRGCILDFVLAARRGYDEAESAFDAWLETFRPGDGRGGDR